MEHFSCFEPRVQGWGRLKVRLRAKVSMNLFRNVALYVAYVPCPIIPDICHRNHKHKPEDEDDSQWQSGIVFTEEFLERLSTYVACLPHLWLESFSCWECGQQWHGSVSSSNRPSDQQLLALRVDTNRCFANRRWTNVILYTPNQSMQDISR